MKKIIIFICIIFHVSVIFGQVTLLTEGTIVNNTTTGNWDGVNIPRSQKTLFTYRNNSITSVNTSGYMLQAGDEAPGSTNNNLDGEVITGNKFRWIGANGPSVISHGLFAGYNTNSVVKYNYLENVPYGIIFKSGTDAGVNMNFTAGGCAYNIDKNGKFAGRVKGINGVKFYNNTFYSGDGGGWYLLLITENMDRTVPAPSTGTKIFNNIFYSTIQIPMIKIESKCLSGFESDYNVYWCSAGEPTFNIDETTVTWAQWRARGYDTHSVIINPNFINTTDFVPATRLDYGKDLGSEWLSGLSTTATWVPGSSPATTNQNGKWQVGARIYEAATVLPTLQSSVVENSTPNRIDITYNLTLAGIIPSPTAFNIMVNSVARTVNSVIVTGTKVQLTLASEIKWGDIVTLAYTKPATNPLQTGSGATAASISSQPIINNLIKPAVISSPVSVKMTITPNHIHNILNVFLEYSGSVITQMASITPEIVRISDLSGKLFIEKLLDTGVTNFKIPLNLQSGIYTVQILGGGIEMISQKLVVH